MSDRLSVSDADLRRLCLLISHDLRNPLAAIVTNLEFARRMLEQLDVDPDLTESVRDSVTACDVLRRIVANFDLVAKGDALRAATQEVELDALVLEVARRCENRAEQACLRIEPEVSGAPRVVSDPALVALALENLVCDGIQHAPADTVISVRVEAPAEVAVIEVRDAGPPVEPTLRDVALGVEGHTSQGRREGTRYGRGLALLAARLAVEGIGGAIDVGDEAGRSVMRLTVPRQAAR